MNVRNVGITIVTVCENEVVGYLNDHTYAADRHHPEVLFVRQEIEESPKRPHSKSLPKQLSSIPEGA